MPQQLALTFSILAAAMIAVPYAPSSCETPKPPAARALDEHEAEYAPIIEHTLEFRDFGYRTLEGAPFDLRAYAQGKSVVIVEYFAGWCPNSNRNGHIVERLWNEYRARGLGVVGVAEYSDLDELRIHINRIGVDYPVVVETSKRSQRKDSLHYKYRREVGDRRKWGTPFYVIIDTRDIEGSVTNTPIAHRVYTVSGEMVEAEADQFIRRRIADAKRP